MTEWDDNLISTGIDRLLQYMQSQEEAEVDEAADFLGVDPETVIHWAKALEESDLVDVTYTATRGRVIQLKQADSEEAEEQIEEAKEEAAQKIEEAGMENEKKRIEQFETVLERLEEVLEQDAKDMEELRDEVGSEDLRKIEAYLDDIEATEKDVEGLLNDLEDVLADISVVRALRQHRAAASDARDARSELLAVDAEKEHTCEECDAAFYTRVGLRMHREVFGHNETIYGCADCGKSFETEKGLHIHEGMKGHGSEPGGVMARIRSMLGGTGTLKCAECESTFKDVDEIRAHQHGTGHRVNPLRCDRCRSRFETLGGLHAHEEMIHHG